MGANESKPPPSEAETVVEEVKEVYDQLQSVYKSLLCCLCLFNNLWLVFWFLCLFWLAFVVFLIIGVILLIVDAETCGMESPVWVFCLCSLCGYCVSLFFSGIYNPPIVHFFITTAFITYGSVVLFTPGR